MFRDIRVPVGETVVRQVDRHIRRIGWFPYTMFTLAPSKENAEAMLSALTIHRQAPNMAHAPCGAMSPAAPCTLSVTITMPPEPTGKENQLSAAPGERLKEAALHYRVNGSESIETLRCERTMGSSIQPRFRQRN